MLDFLLGTEVALDIFLKYLYLSHCTNTDIQRELGTCSIVSGESQCVFPQIRKSQEI